MFTKKIKYLLVVSNMHCEHCVKKVEESLKSIAGVKKVYVNLEKQEVQVISENEIDSKILEEHLKDYPIQKIEKIS